MAAHIATIDAYIASFPDDVQIVLGGVRRAILKAAPSADEVIKYQMPTLVINGKNAVHFAAWKRYISIYPVPETDEALEEELAPYRAARSTLRFPLKDPLPYDLITQVAERLIQQRAGEG